MVESAPETRSDNHGFSNPTALICRIKEHPTEPGRISRGQVLSGGLEFGMRVLNHQRDTTEVSTQIAERFSRKMCCVWLRLRLSFRIGGLGPQAIQTPNLSRHRGSIHTSWSHSHTYIHTYIYTYLYIYIYTYIYIYKDKYYVYIYIYAPVMLPSRRCHPNAQPRPGCAGRRPVLSRRQPVWLTEILRPSFWKSHRSDVSGLRSVKRSAHPSMCLVHSPENQFSALTINSLEQP